MTRTYGSHNVLGDPARCEESVPTIGGWHRSQCSRKRVNGGVLCTQHAKIHDRCAREREERKAESKCEAAEGYLLSGDRIFMHALKSMAIDLYNAEFGRLRRGEVAPPANEWINDLIELELSEARKVRVKI